MRSRRARPKVYGKRRRTKRSNKRIARIAKRVMSRMAENKNKRQNAAYFIYNNPLNAAWATNVRDVTSFLRSIPQGTGSSERVGTVINLKRLTYTAMVTPNAGDPDGSWPVVVKLWVVSDRYDPNNSDTTAIQNACAGVSGEGNFFDSNGTTVGLYGNLQDTFNPINTTRFKVHTARTLKVGASIAPNTGATTWTFGNNDFKFMRRVSINLLKYMPKTFKYNEALTTGPQYTRKLFLVWQAIRADGSTPAPTEAVAGVVDGYNLVYEDP